MLAPPPPKALEPGLFDLSVQAVGAAFYLVDAAHRGGAARGGAASAAGGGSSALGLSSSGMSASAGSLPPGALPHAATMGAGSAAAAAAATGRYSRSVSMGALSTADSDVSGAPSGAAPAHADQELLRMLALYADVSLHQNIRVSRRCYCRLAVVGGSNAGGRLRVRGFLQPNLPTTFD
jgi:hypothetical protein